MTASNRSSVAAVLFGICFYGLSLAGWSQELPPLRESAGVRHVQDPANDDFLDSESDRAPGLVPAVILAQASVAKGPQSAQKRKVETSEDFQRLAEEALQKFPTQNQINTIQKKSDRDYVRRVRNMLVKAQREGKTWNRDKRNQFQEDLETALRRGPSGGENPKALPAPQSDNVNSPGGACYFCPGVAPPSSTCGQRCKAEHYCCMSENGCWVVQGNYCVKRAYCGGECAFWTEVCIAWCLIPGKPNVPDPTVTDLPPGQIKK
jgi:hypothetical protein